MTKNYMELNLKLITPPVISCIVKYCHLIIVQHTGFSDGWKATRVSQPVCYSKSSREELGNLDLSTSWISFYLIS